MEILMKLPLKLNNYLVLLSGILLLAAGCSQSNKKEDDTARQGRSIEYSKEVTFLNSEGQEITSIQVAVADDAGERNMGLMDVNDLPADRGMLFVFEQQQPLSFWMANTPLSLDIFFVNEALEIVRIHQNTQPFSEKNLTSEKPARYVIETNGGFSLSHDIQEGMKVEFEIKE